MNRVDRVPALKEVQSNKRERESDVNSCYIINKKTMLKVSSGWGSTGLPEVTGY